MEETRNHSKSHKRHAMELNGFFFKEILNRLDEGVYFVDLERRITFWNQGAEKIAGYASDEVVGRRCCDNILKHVDSAGRNLCEGDCPLMKSVADGTPSEGKIFLHHKSGHRVPVEVKIIPLRNDSGNIIGGVEVFSELSKTNVSMEMLEDLRKQVFIDPLTQIPNRRYLETVIHGRLDEQARYNWPFALIFLDIDHFKVINDNYGHNTGDETLRMVAKSLVSCSRSFDTVGRWGGEEFVAIIVNVDEPRLRAIAERYRIIIEKSLLAVDNGQINVTISLGATLGKAGDSLESLVSRADALMYRSKLAGRNCVTMDVLSPVQSSEAASSLSFP